MGGPRFRRGLLCAWLATVLLVTLAPFWPLRDSARGFAPASRLGVADFALNLALFAPGGVLLRALGPGASACTALAALLSLGIESAQMWIPHRYPSQLDVLANALGALAGALAAGTWARRRKGEACGRRGAQAGSRTGAEGEARRRRRLPASP